ncbi:peptide chain release factor N(5)-glutamine methyltransferase [Aquimarina spongiae]|uniref:Release factor glutamine methyltransferase n=1 Tax=Aquimarina spongiae TaxID=570521 RepID=A0A1M6G2S8_9FLAO|nr:peptide chain release factor N(5)-glutamine methyltransferase [Aquimarina spongiae]SHJ04219.1 release factor glutamine methyltransferase [Aquimarina spongiae]
MKIKDLRTHFKNALSKAYDAEEVMSFFYLLTEKRLGLRRVDIALQLERELSEDALAFFKEAEIRLLDFEPVQYIIGDTEFFGLSFLVNENVLIPRPETEELVDWILKDHLGVAYELKILDIGTGSGCIAITLAKNLPNAKVYAIDVSEKALALAKQNADKNQVKIEFIQLDVLKEEIDEANFDIVVSNPPYVRELEKTEMKTNVLENEPALALFVSNDDPLIFYRRISVLSKQLLTEHGRLYFEINQYLGAETKELIDKLQFNTVTLRKDIYQNDRMIRADLN